MLGTGDGQYVGFLVGAEETVGALDGPGDADGAQLNVVGAADGRFFFFLPAAARPNSSSAPRMAAPP